MERHSIIRNGSVLAIKASNYIYKEGKLSFLVTGAKHSFYEEVSLLLGQEEKYSCYCGLARQLLGREVSLHSDRKKTMMISLIAKLGGISENLLLCTQAAPSCLTAGFH